MSCLSWIFVDKKILADLLRYPSPAIHPSSCARSASSKAACAASLPRTLSSHAKKCARARQDKPRRHSCWRLQSPARNAVSASRTTTAMRAIIFDLVLVVQIVVPTSVTAASREAAVPRVAAVVFFVKMMTSEATSRARPTLTIRDAAARSVLTAGRNVRAHNATVAALCAKVP